ncbi:MAG: nuclear transport factor 2 family protein [Sphingopyxis sp.]|nr:nuclear transport factor 2 family protein [Sphingopyxis sp.]
MTKNLLAAAAAFTLAFGFSATTHAQMPTWSTEQMGAWKVVSDSWVDDVAQNGKWPGEYADPQFITWSTDSPSPRNRDGAIRWTRFNEKQGKVLHYEITPQAIALSGNTAVVSYTLLIVTQQGTDKPDHDQEAITETLVRSGGSWKYLSSVSFPLD